MLFGGTGLYIDSLVYAIEYQEMEYNENYRKKLEKEETEKLYNIAMKIDEEAAKKISKTDKKRIIRILEIYKATGKTKTQIEEISKQNKPPYNYVVFALNMDRQKLYERINNRVDKMIEEGLIKEVEELLKKYKEFPTAMQGLGYKEVKEYIENKITKEEMIDKIKLETRHFAKRQLTWFRKNKQIIWLNAEEDIDTNIKTIIKEADI